MLDDGSEIGVRVDQALAAAWVIADKRHVAGVSGDTHLKHVAGARGIGYGLTEIGDQACMQPVPVRLAAVRVLVHHRSIDECQAADNQAQTVEATARHAGLMLEARLRCDLAASKGDEANAI